MKNGAKKIVAHAKKNGAVLPRWARPANHLTDMIDVLNEVAFAFGDESVEAERLRGLNTVNNQRLAFFRLALKAGLIKSVTERPALAAGK